MPWWDFGLGHDMRTASKRIKSAQRSAFAWRLLALAASCVLSACGEMPLPETDAGQMSQPRTELRARIGESPTRVAGIQLNTTLLLRFYARHGFEPVWTTRPAQAKSLAAAIARAGDQGLDPDLFHAGLLRHLAALTPIDRDLVESDAFLSYADALARGAVPIERRSDAEVLTPGPVDVPAALDAAMDSHDPGAKIESLAPHTPSYLALRQALRTTRQAASSRKVPAGRLQTIEVGLERLRWLPRSLPPDRAWVNAADEHLTLYRGGRPVFTTRVVVGEDIKHNQTPEFRATIDAGFFDPPWVIPKDIVANEILPKIDHDPDYLTKNNMILLDGGEAEQLPGPTAGLGLIMFDMPNKFDVYLHDTPERNVFKRDNRRISHGCIRVQNPLELAALLLKQPIAEINKGVASTTTTRHDLTPPVPVFVVYQTVFLDSTGTLQYRPDFYQRDAVIWRALRNIGEQAVLF